MTLATPPGDRSGYGLVIKNILTGQRFDGLAFARYNSDTYGAFTFTKFGPVRFYQVADPDLAHEILVKRTDEFHKGIIKEVLQPFLGDGLLTSEGDFWKRQRKLAQPAFHARRIASYAGVMVEYTRRLLNGWRDGETRWIDREMMKLTLGIVSKTLFDADVSAEADRVGELMNSILDATNERLTAVIRLPEYIPTPRRMQVKRITAELDAIIQRIVDERRRAGEDKGDLLSMLLTALDDDGSGMSDKQLRDELMTLFLAGHETTANTLIWALVLLAQHPAALTALHAEIESVLGSRDATFEDLPNLPYSEQVIKETLRLFPTAPGVSRSPTHDLELGGYTVPKDAFMQISIYAMHHSNRYWQEPEAFRPERFAPEAEKLIPHYAYLPFGGGPRICIGNQFAMMEARLALITLVQHADLSLDPAHPPVAEQMFTLRPRGGVKMVVRKR